MSSSASSFLRSTMPNEVIMMPSWALSMYTESYGVESLMTTSPSRVKFSSLTSPTVSIASSSSMMAPPCNARGRKNLTSLGSIPSAIFFARLVGAPVLMVQSSSSFIVVISIRILSMLIICWYNFFGLSPAPSGAGAVFLRSTSCIRLIPPSDWALLLFAWYPLLVGRYFVPRLLSCYRCFLIGTCYLCVQITLVAVSMNLFHESSTLN